MYFFYIIICMTTFISTMTAAPLIDDEEDSKKPDIDDFISRLLKSEMFEQLADKIAARAADKIISAQHLPQHVGIRAKNDVTGKQPTTTITTNKTKDKKNKENFDKDTQENEDDKNTSNESKPDSDDQEDLPEKPKIDTIAAIKKISKFPIVDLSLSFKHFTTRDKLKSIIPRITTEKDTKHKSKKSYRKKANQTKVENYDAILRSRPELKSDSQSESSQTTESESSDESTSGEHNRKSSETEEKEILNKNIKREKQENKNKDSESKSILVSKEILKTSINKNDNLIEKNDVGTPISSSVTERPISTVAFGYILDSENSEESDDNKVSNIVDPAKIDNKMLRSLRSDIQKDEDADKEKINDSNKKTDGEKNGDGSKNSKKIDTKHKIREKNGKLYAFAQSPDYEEYHEQVGNLLKAVKNKDKEKQNNVNQDLLDLIN